MKEDTCILYHCVHRKFFPCIRCRTMEYSVFYWRFTSLYSTFNI